MQLLWAGINLVQIQWKIIGNSVTTLRSNCGLTLWMPAASGLIPMSNVSFGEKRMCFANLHHQVVWIDKVWHVQLVHHQNLAGTLYFVQQQLITETHWLSPHSNTVFLPFNWHCSYSNRSPAQCNQPTSSYFSARCTSGTASIKCTISDF